MSYWDTAPTDDPDDVGHDYARVWQAADKIVYSRSLEQVSSPRTTLEHDFDPDAVAHRVVEADRDVSVGGPHLAAEALRAGIVDELRIITVPVVVGGGTWFLPDGIHLDLDLLDQRRFAGGSTWTRYAVRR